jgi:predicted dehydrogenase
VKRPTSRRNFLKQTTLAGAGFWVAARSTGYTAETSPNEKLNIGVIGCGGKGLSDMQSVTSENIVALCDVDEKQAAQARKEQPQAKFYYDFRELLEKEKTLDAVIVATPDHMHAPASVMAMKLGKHVYTQKPLVHSVYEARVMREVAAQKKVATQMGNQGTAEGGLRRAAEVIQAGAIGDVKEVHVWSNRPIWPQGMDRPSGSKPAPDSLKWDLWLGVAPERPYNDGYCPFVWRGWLDFGTGALGDMACHTVNMPFMALKLREVYPTSVEAKCSGINKEAYPKWSEIKFEFPARGTMPPVNLFWYDGSRKPAAEVTGDMKVPGSGCMLVGTKGKLFSPDDYGSSFKLFPEEDFKDFKGPAESIPRSPGHYQEWLRAAKGGPAAMSNFDYSSRLTEVILLGNISLRVGKKIEWDGPNMKSTNCPEATQLAKREYRKGYTL